jgi:hypothetical protein
MISVINGYVCTSSCEAASARQSKNPTAPPGSPPGVSGKENKTSPSTDQAATILDGSLKRLAGLSVVTATDNVWLARLDRLA